MENNKSKKKLVITWQRLISKGNTCPRCNSTERELNKAMSQLKKRGIKVILEKRELTLEEFNRNPVQSNKIIFNGKLLEDLIGAETGQSQCCSVCGDKKCRTLEIGKESYETIPADMIVRAGIVAVKIESKQPNRF